MNSGASGNKDLISKLTDIILSNLENEKFGGEELAREAGLRISVLNRNVKHTAQKTVNQFIREVRLKKAMELLLNEDVTASEVAFKVGFNSPSYFSTCFSEYFGYPPGEVKKRSLNGTGETKEESFVNPVVTNQESAQTIVKLPWWKMHGRRAVTFVSFIILFILAFIYVFNQINPGSFNFLTASRLTKHAKTIAVLPFINDSHDPENVYFINGVNEAILDYLAKIKDLEVRPRTSVEKYRSDKSKSTPQIARELGVSYIVEGSGQKIGDQVSLIIQLIEASSDKHLFSIRYNLKLEDIFALQSEVALKVASEIEAIITQDEKELISTPPTKSVAAWEMYSHGYELRNIADLENTVVNDRQAEYFFKRAIQLDSTYAEPYVQLGWICLSHNETDSAFIYADKALHFDSKNSNAYILKGWLFGEENLKNKAEEAFNLAIQFNPNCSQAYDLLGDMYYNRGDSYMAIKNKLKAIKIESNSIETRNSLISLWDSFNNVGLYDEAQKYAEKLITLTGDSTYYYWSLLQLEYNSGNYRSVDRYARKIYNTDSLNLGKLLGFHHSYFLGNTYVNLREYKKAYQVLEKYTASMKMQGRTVHPYHYFGYIYLKNGKKEEADFHFEGSIRDRFYFIEQNKPNEVSPPNLGLAFIYAAQGKKEKALEHLRVVNRCVPFLYTCSQITGFKISPMVDCIRDEPEYREFLKNAEVRYQEEHNKVAKLLAREGALISSNK